MKDFSQFVEFHELILRWLYRLLSEFHLRLWLLYATVTAIYHCKVESCTYMYIAVTFGFFSFELKY